MARPPLAILLGVLLILPLAWALRWALPGGPVGPETSGRDGGLVPSLSPEVRGPLPTFLRSCQGDEDCDAPLICLRGLPLVKPFCTASDCVTNVDCQEGFTCRALAVGPHVVRLCAVEGQVEEGGPCQRLPRRQSEGCKPGLVCAAGLCGRPCLPEGPRSCPQGFLCSSGDVEGPACLPTCEGHPCPEGQQCVRLRQGASVCARVHGTECQRTPCPEGLVCDVVAPPSRKGEVWMQCERPCDKQGPPCPEGRICAGERCRLVCEQGKTGTCGPDEVCVGLEPEKPGLCAFNF
jgi:hypothetical protein